MNEWTGSPNHAQIKQINLAINSTLPGLLQELTKSE